MKRKVSKLVLTYVLKSDNYLLREHATEYTELDEKPPHIWLVFPLHWRLQLIEIPYLPYEFPQKQWLLLDNSKVKKNSHV